MKRIIVIALGTWIASHGFTQTFITNQVSGNFSDFLVPQSKYYAGIEHEYRYFSVKANHPGHAGGVNNFFHTFNITGRVKAHKRVSIFFNLPIHYYEQKKQDVKIEFGGPGDVSVIAQYQVIRSKDSISGKIKQSLFAGAGIKFPTGRYNLYDQNGFYDRYAQIGTGSWDVILNAQYMVKWNKWGVNSSINAKISTENPDNYQYGHHFQLATEAFYWGKGEIVSVLLRGGLSYNYQTKDYYLRQFQSNSGGHLLAGNLNADFYVKRFVFGVNFKLPVYSLLASGTINNGPQITSNLTVTF